MKTVIPTPLWFDKNCIKIKHQSFGSLKWFRLNFNNAINCASTPNIHNQCVLLDFSLSIKAATLIFISGRGSAISSAKEGKSGFIYNLVTR